MALASETQKGKESKELATRRSTDLMTRWEQDFERMFDQFWRRPFLSLWGPDRWLRGRTRLLQMPVMDVYEEKDHVIVKAELPGLSKDEIDLSIIGSILTLKGEKKKQEEIEDEHYRYSERSFGSFSRSIELPADVKTDQVAATFKNGVLEIRLPKTEEAKKKSLKVTIS